MLRKKMLRDLRFNKIQFFTIFLMVFLGVFVFSGIHAYMDGMKKSADVYYEENNLQDLWLLGENFTTADMEEIKKLDNIKEAERVLTITTTLDHYEDVTLETNFIETNHLSQMYVIEGEAFEQGKKGVWMDSYLAKNLNLKVGDEITFTYQKYKVTEKILGLVNTPDHVYGIKNDSAIFPTHKDFGFLYLSINEFPEDYIYDEMKDKISIQTGIDQSILNKDQIKQFIPDFKLEDYYVFNSVLIKVENIAKMNETKKDLEDKIEAVIAVTDRNANMSYQAYLSEIEEGKTYSSVFTLLFLFIAILSVITTMNRFVKKQRTQIGILKALGFQKSKIVRHYISYGFYISLIASILGIVAGKFTLGEFFLNMQMQFYEIPVYDTTLLPIIYWLAIAVIFMVTLITYLACRKVLKEPASQALRVEVSKVKQIKFDITTTRFFKKSSLSTRWNLRDMARNKGRTIMGIVGVVGCTMLIVCAFGMLDTMNSYLDWQFDELYSFQYKLLMENDYTIEEFDKITKEYGNATSQTLGIEIKKKDGSKETNTVTINDAKDYLKYTGHNRESIDLNDDDVWITEKLSDQLGLKVGDDITWHILGEDTWHTTKITGLNREPQNQSLNVTKKYAEALGISYQADSIYTNADLSQIKELEGVKTIQSISILKEGMQGMLENIKIMVVILIIASIILGCVIIYNLGILSFSEKQYQFATLKVLGLKEKQIKKIFVKQNVWITVIAIIIGLPLGFYMTDYIFKAALGNNYDFNAQIRIFSYLYASIGTFLVSLLVNQKLSKKIKTIDMVSSLKANE